ncbi:MAG: hypothetical protein Q9195_009169 [Heterodermia aff. obscurata]
MEEGDILRSMKVNLSICSEQEGDTRYPRTSSEDENRPPPVSLYRNNLAALSQRYNYLFIAYRSEIRVYQPEFPTQNVPRTAILTFELPNSDHRLRGCELNLVDVFLGLLIVRQPTLDIDPTNPHAINHIIVGDIGDQETLLAACDDGDVVAISTRLIHRAAQRNIAVAQGVDDLPADDVRAFFTGNVGASAWGLAIQKEARLFAVSANTHHIMVFAFALGGGPGEESSSDSEEDVFDGTLDDLTQNADWNILAGRPAPGQRASQNLQIVLRGHRTNIPNIAFCNIDADTEGKYLISTDIENCNYVWDIWQQKRICSFPFPGYTAHESGADSERRGWGVACLDPLTFRLTKTRSQTFGLKNPRKRKFFGDEYDVTPSVEHVSGSSRIHPAMSEFGTVPGLLNVRTQAYGDLPSLLDGLEDEDDEDALEDGSDDEGVDAESPQAQVASLAAPSTNSPQSLTQRTPIPGEWTDVIPTLFENSRPAGSRQSTVTATTSLSPPTSFELPFQILHTSEHNIHAFLNQGGTRIVCQNALQQRVPPRLRMLTTFDRLNMIHQIPELGVVIVGSAVGRVALLTMTKLNRTESALSGFHIDWILPLKSQEDKGVRPEAPLMGIAVSPVQGQANSGEISDDDGSSPDAGRHARRSGTRKYRIMLVYAEQTILCYEIKRPIYGTGYEVNDRTILLSRVFYSFGNSPTQPGIKAPVYPSASPQVIRYGKPCHGRQSTRTEPHKNLLRAMVVQVNTAPRDDTGTNKRNGGKEKPLGNAERSVRGRSGERCMTKEEEEGQGDGEEGGELGVGGGHAREIQHFTPELAKPHEHDLGFAGRPYKRRVDNAESLRDEGEPGAEIGNRIVGILLSPLANVGIDGTRAVRSERG